MAGTDVGRTVVGPGGRSFLSMLFGPDFNPYDPQQQMNLFGQGGMFGGAGESSIPAYFWNEGLQGRGIVDPSAQYTQAGKDADSRYAGWGDAWNQWYGNDLYDPQSGRTLPSLMRTTGNRTFQDFGAHGGVGLGDYGPSQAVNAYIGSLRDPGNAYLSNPLYEAEQARRAFSTSPWEKPDAANYMSMGQDVNEASDPDPFGLRGIRKTNRLVNKSEQKLLRDIDTESQNSLALQIPEVRAQMQAMGLSDSGSATRMGGDVAKSILDQANRDKQRTMAGFRESNLGRQADAINLSSNIGAQGALAGRDVLSRFGSQGLGDMFSMNEAQRGAERNSLLQGAQRYQDKEMGLADLFGRTQMGFDANQLNRQIGQDNAQHQAFGDYMSLQQSADQFRRSRLDEMLGLADYQRGISQERLNQQMQYGMMPMNMLMQLVSGIQTGGQPTQGRTTPFWQQALAGIGGQALGGYMQGLGQPYPSTAGGRPEDWNP